MFLSKYLEEDSMIAAYTTFISSFFSKVTAPTLRYLFGFLVNHDTVTAHDFLYASPAKGTSHKICTRYMPESRNEEYTELYLDKCVAPTSVVVWFWNRTGQNKWLHYILLTGFNYQSFDQFSSFVECGFNFYTKERYVVFFNLI